MRHLTLTAFALLFSIGAPGTVMAQHTSDAERTHRSVWLGGGLGGGVNDDSNWGGGGYFRIGGTLGQNLLLGGEAIGFVREERDVTLSQANATVVALLYAVESGFFVKGGVGFATVEASVSEGDVTVSGSESGFGSTLGGRL